MRTTLDIADDVLQAAKELARSQKTSAGEVISQLARKGLKAAPGQASADEGEELLGFGPFPSRGGVVTNDLIDRLRDEDRD
jgi:hypothetical protein